MYYYYYCSFKEILILETKRKKGKNDRFSFEIHWKKYLHDRASRERI